MARFVQLEDLPEKDILLRLREGALFLYPTDTVYCLGCDATNERAIKLLKSLPSLLKPLCFIPPSKVWLKKYFMIADAFLAKMPGPFTFIVEPRNGRVPVCSLLAFRGTYRVRFPDHPFMKLLAKADIPFVDTTVMGRTPGIFDVTQVPPEILAMVDIVIVAGVCRKPLSSLIDLTTERPLLVTR